MSIPTTFAPIKSQDFTLTPIKVNKKFTFNQNEFETTSSGYSLTEGYYTSLKTPIGSPKAANDPRNELDGSFKHIIWHSINHQYYKTPYNSFTTLEHWNPRYTHKFLNLSASLLSIPYLDYGERIQKKSVEIINYDLDLRLIDDGRGNLYDPALEESLVSYSRNNTISYWGFNTEFLRFKYNYGVVEEGSLQYEAHTFSPYNYPSTIYNVKFDAGPEISGSNTGISALFDYDQNGSTSYIMTPDHEQYNFDSTEEFGISCWIQPITGSGIGSIISKNGVEFQNLLGIHDKILDSGQITNHKYISGSCVNSSTDVFPYELLYDYDSELVTFTRSDGLHTISLSASASLDSWTNINIVRHSLSGSYYCSLFINGIEEDTGIDNTIHPINKNCLMFGSKNLQGDNQYTGNLDEVRFTNKVYYSGSILDSNKYSGLADLDNMYNTSVVGNVFYRRGNIVVSPIYPKYQDIFSGSWEMTYKGTHTIYQYEVLCRIKKGDFNLTMNPSARKSPKSDVLIDDMTGSLLRPYMTTIGMYNDAGELLAIGKMGQAIQMRDDVDLNVLIRFDG